MFLSRIAKMKTTKCSWSTVIVQVFFVAALPLHAFAYKILMITVPGKSHIFQLAAMSESLVNNGHQVVFLVGQSYPLNLPELRNRSEFSVVRYRDTAKGAYLNYSYDVMEETFIKSAIESSGDMLLMLSTLWKMYANFLVLVIRLGPIVRSVL